MASFPAGRGGGACEAALRHMVALSTKIIHELRLEGYARGLVRHIQELRKDAGFELGGRLVTYLKGGEVLAEVLSAFGDYAVQEALSRRLVTDAESFRGSSPQAG